MTANPMNTNLDPGKITQLLTISARQLDASTLSALRNARQNALQRQAVRSPVFTLSTNQGAFHSLIPHSVQQWAVAGLLMALLIIGAGYWQRAQEEQATELDVAILTDDLPIDAYVD